MAIFGTIPRRCVNLPPGSLGTLLGKTVTGRLREGGALEAFTTRFAEWLGDPALHVFGASTGRSAFQLALEALGMEKGKEIIFPVFTFPVMPMVAKLLGYEPVFCDVDPTTWNAGPKEIEPKITERTGAVLATHLFGRPCPIEETAALCKERGILLLEDCAHACGVRVDGRRVGTFGDVGVFSFAQGKNMPCLGGGAIAIREEAVAARARVILADKAIPPAGEVFKTGLSVWIKWLVTRPWVFGLTAYQALKLKQWMGKPLMDSAVGDELVERFERSNPTIEPLANLQATIGLRQLKHIDAFNEGARKNAQILTEGLAGVKGVRVPPTDGEHIYVYYPLGMDADVRDEVRHHLLKRGVDTKCTDMADCGELRAFRGDRPPKANPAEAKLLEICVYPTLSAKQMRKIAAAIREWSAARSGTAAS